MSHSLLYLWAAPLLLRAAHRAAVDLTVRDITVWCLGYVKLAFGRIFLRDVRDRSRRSL